MKSLFLKSFLFFFLIDQVSKFFASQFSLTTLNFGISFGLAGQIGNLFLSFLLTLILLLLAWFFQSTWKKYPEVAGAFFGASVSNLADRSLFGGVRDWLPIPGMGLQNNIADWVIFCSLAVILWKEIRVKRIERVQ